MGCAHSRIRSRTQRQGVRVILSTSVASDTDDVMSRALKVSRTLLATVPDSLPHWAMHARLEALRGKLNDARKVYQTVLNATFQNRHGEAALWWDWAQMEWLARNDDAAQQVIIRSTGVAGSGGVARHAQKLPAARRASPLTDQLQ